MPQSTHHARRDLGLDAARAFATFAMVVGHTLDGLLDESIRESPIIATYWKYRGLTAPLFLFVSGWAVATVVARSKATGAEVVRARLPRIGLLFACGFLLRLPTWGIEQLVAGNEKVWRHTLAFDALHCIAASMLLGVLILALFRAPSLRLGALATAAAVAGFFATPIWNALAHAPLFIQQSFGAGTAPFTVFPWAGYFFAGTVVGVWSTTGVSPRTRGLVLAVSGVLLVVAGYGVVTRSVPIPDARLFAIRIGQVLVFNSAWVLLPDAVGRRVAPLGRASLGVYLVHLPIIYGWGSIPGLAYRYGKTLPLPAALLLGVSLLVASYAVTVLWARTRATLETAIASRGVALPRTR